MFGIKVYGYVEPDKLSDLAHLCDVNGAELCYSSCGEKFFEVYRDTVDRRDFNSFCQSVRQVLCGNPEHTHL